MPFFWSKWLLVCLLSIMGHFDPPGSSMTQENGMVQYEHPYTEI